MNWVLAALVGAIAFVLALAVRRRNVAAAVNAMASLAVTGLAVAVPVSGSGAATALALWTGVAALLHAVGMLGPYDSVWWWDHLTHTVSAALLAALIYAGLIVVGADVPRALAAAGAVAYTAVGGVFWELVELVARAVGERYGVEPVLVHYGWDDTAYDLLFDVLGAVVVVGLDVRLFVALVARAPATARAALVWSSAALLVGGAAMALFLFVRSEIPRA